MGYHQAWRSAQVPAMPALSLSDALIVVRALGAQLTLHLERGLECVNPPVLTTYYLNRAGYPRTLIRGFWRRVGDGLTLNVYRAAEVSASIVLEHVKGVAYHDQVTGLPVDQQSCRRLGGCVVATNTNKLYVLLEVAAGENLVRINAVNLLCIVEKLSPGSGRRMVRLVERFLETGSARDAWDLLSTLNGLLREHGGVLRLLSPSLPASLEEALHGSRLLRTLYAHAAAPRGVPTAARR